MGHHQTDAAGYTTSYAYDRVGRLTVTTNPDLTTRVTTYDAAGRATASTDEAGKISHTGYDAAGRVTSESDPLGNTTITTYDAAGNALATTDPLTHATQSIFDADNRVTATLMADGTSTQSTYDAAGRVVAKTDALGRVTSFGYDALGRLTTVTDALGQVTTYGYDEIGERVSQTDANGHVTKFGYDKRGRQNLRKLPDNSSESSAYDVAGEKTSRVDFNAKTTTYGYDTLGRLTSRSYASDATENVSFTYTPDGRRATAVDARGTTTYGYDTRRRVTLVTYPDGRSLEYGYDPRGLRTTLTTHIGAQSLTTTTAYDDAGRASTVTDPLGRSFAATYDAASRRTELDYPNTTKATYAYDVNNRLTNLTTTQQTDHLAPVTIQSNAYTLDSAGKRTQVAEADGTVRLYGYDAIDRLVGEGVTGSLSYAKTFTYDAVGNRKTQVTTGTGAASDTYAYDTRDRLTSETAPAATYTYDANGNTLTKSNEATYTWDLENRLTKATMENGTVVQHTYDADGNRVKTVAPQATGATSCSGSSAMFVKADTTTQGNWEGTYGADGDYINAETAEPPTYGGVTFTGTSSFTWAASTTDVRALEQPPPQTSRIASTYFSATTETFHVTTTDNEAHTVAFYLLDWDNVGRAESVTAKTTSGTVLDGARPFSGFSGGVYAVYTICGSVDFTVTRTAGANAVVSGVFFGTAGAATATNYLVDAAGGLSQVVAESDASGSLTAEYVRAGDELLAVMRPGGTGGMWTTKFVHHDGLGSVRALTDETATTTDTRGYEAFGTKNTSAGSDSLAYGFAGEPLDTTTHLAYHRARWMDSRVGRFVGMDKPHRSCRSVNCRNTYSYGNDNPTGVVDPSGHDGVDSIADIWFSVFGNRGATVSEAGGKLLYVQLRVRPIDDSIFFEHSYIEYVEKTNTTSERKIIEAGPDNTPGTGRGYGYLFGFERNWGEKRPAGTGRPYTDAVGGSESEDDTAIPTTGVDASTHGCLQKWTGIYNSWNIKYDETDGYKTTGGRNSNWWSENILFACGVKPVSALPIAAFTFDLPFVDDTADGESRP